MGYLPYSCGFQRLTASGTVSDAGKPILISGVAVTSGATVAVPYILNGAAGTAAIAFRCDGAAATARTTAFHLPPMLPSGCYVSFDANTTEVTVFYVLQSVTT